MKRVAIFLLIVAGLGAAFWITMRRNNVEPSPVSGTIEVDEAHLASRYGGRVEKIDAQEGDAPRAGEPIVELEASELRARRDNVAAQLAELERGPRVQEIDAARHDWESLSAQLEFARADAQRSQDLLKEKAISPNEAQRSMSTANSLEKSAEATRKRFELLQEGTRPERIDQARAQLAEIDAQLREMRIVAPRDCILETLDVKVGDVLSADRVVATVLFPQHLWVRVYVPETWLGRIKLGENVRARVDSWPNEDFRGTVEQINRQAEFTPRNVQTVEDRVKQVFGVKVRLDNSADKLRAGMSADVFFPNVPQKP